MAGGAIALSGGARTSSSTAGMGNGGTVKVAAQGPLSLSDPGSGITASAASTAQGNAGSVAVSAPQITLMTGSEISSTTVGSGAGGPVQVTTPGALVLDGQGVAATQIAASATGTQSGPGGSVTVTAGSLTVEGGAQIASTTTGPGNGGDVEVAVVSDITLPDRGLAIGAGGLRRIRLIGSKAARDGVTPRRQNYPLRDASVRRASNETGAQSR